MYWVIRWLIRAIVEIVLLGHIHVTGRENFPKRGGVLVISNHIATADPPLQGVLLPRPLNFMAKVEWFKNPVIGYLASSFRCFPVVRHTADRRALKRALELLAAGEVVCIYPEGTRALDARLHRAEAGAGFLARHSGAPIVPVAIWGTEKLWPKGTRMFRPFRHCHVAIGQPFHLRDAVSSNEAAAEEMMRKVAEMLPDQYRGYYAARDTIRRARPKPATGVV
jgi:1-acyl-sn-glycerol-3-phosphate acyltransferase